MPWPEPAPYAAHTILRDAINEAEAMHFAIAREAMEAIHGDPVVVPVRELPRRVLLRKRGKTKGEDGNAVV